MFGTHATILFLLIVIPWIKNLLRPKPKEIVTFVEMAAAPAATVAEPAPAKPVPEPAKPAPVPKPQPKKTIPKPKPKPEPKKEEPAKPKWKPAPVVRQDRRVANPNAAQQQQSKVDLTRLRNVLQSSPSGAVSPFASYYNLVQQRCYSVWRQPSGTPIGITAIAAIRIENSGVISSKYISKSSGNAEFDQSVQNALNAVGNLPAPPNGLPNPVSVEFVLSN